MQPLTASTWALPAYNAVHEKVVVTRPVQVSFDKAALLSGMVCCCCSNVVHVTIEAENMR